MTDTTAALAEAPVKKKRSVPDPLTEDGVLILCRLAALGVTTRVLSQGFRLSPKTIKRLVTRDAWKTEVADTPGLVDE